MIIKNGNIITPFEILYNTDVKTCNGFISEISKNIELINHDVIDATGMFICPGLVDIHTHGGGGGDFMDATEESFESALSFHIRNGTTSLLATSVTAPIDQIVKMLSVVRKYISKKDSIILGAHIEGPYISSKNKGAQHESYLLNPAYDGYQFILDNIDVISIVTMSPELDGTIKMTKDLVKKGVLVSGGHDNGDKETIMPLIDAGMSHCTHHFCAMSTVKMRNGIRSVGLTELGLIDERLSIELIADNHHLPPELVRLAYKCKGASKICVVSDCLRAGGMGMDGKLYTLGSKEDKNAQKFIVSGDVAKLPDGSRYAGSIQPISKMVQNMVLDCNIPFVDAVRMASYTPAKIIGKSHEIGSVSSGKKANFCLMDKKYNVVGTIINGELIKEGLN